MCCNTKCWLIAGAVVGGLLAILGGVLIPVGDLIIEAKMKKDIVIENGTIAFDNWITPGSPVYRQFWLFHVENPSEIISSTKKPLLVQKGPYTYRTRYLPKKDITQNADHTVSYSLPLEAYFVPELSVGPEDDKVTVLNLAVAGAPSVIPEIAISLVNGWIKKSNSSLFQTRTVKEILWGYQDPFLEAIPNLFIKDKTTGVFYPFNGTFEGPYIVYNGKDTIEKTAIIKEYQGSSFLRYWNNTYCNMINGTDAASFPPFVDKKKALYFFSPDVCRSLYAEYESTRNLKGIPTYHFTLPSSAFASPLVNPDNECYCTEKEISMNCSAEGVLDISGCQDKKPIYLSLPHFLYVSDYISQTVDGLQPNKEEHETFIDVEPTTGFTLQYSKRLQINLMFKPTDKIDLFSKLKSPLLFPVLWLNETATIEDEKADFFKSTVTIPMNALNIIQICLICLGSVLFLACSIALCVRASKSKSIH
ncbi:platelet glycoprotein 4 isoform X1 [Pleurodeles waltl]